MLLTVYGHNCSKVDWVPKPTVLIYYEGNTFSFGWLPVALPSKSAWIIHVAIASVVAAIAIASDAQQNICLCMLWTATAYRRHYLCKKGSQPEDEVKPNSAVEYPVPLECVERPDRP